MAEEETELGSMPKPKGAGQPIFSMKRLSSLENDPKTYLPRKKKTILLTIALASSIIPFSSVIYYPALPDVQVDLNTTQQLANATISTFTIFTAIFPLVWASLSEINGRRNIYLLAFTIYVVASVFCALSKNIVMLLVFRGVAAIGGSCVMAMGAGTIADIYEPHERGRAFALYSVGPLIGPSIGPVIGGYLNQYLGWRSIFWGLSIYGFVILCLVLFLLPETWRPPAFGELPATSEKIQPHSTPPAQPVSTRINPFSALTIFKYPNMDFVFVYVAFVFLSLYCVNTSFSHTFSVQYNFSSGLVGLCYIPSAVGCILGSLVAGPYSDWAYHRALQRNGGTGWPEMRLGSTWGSAVVFPAAYVAYGWLVQRNVHFGWPLVTQFILAFFMMLTNITINIYLADAFKRRAASATACNNLVRYIFATIGPLIADPGQRNLGDGWLYTILGLLQLTPLPLLIFVHRNGPRWSKMRGDT